MPPFPDETYPVSELSLQEFNTLASEMCENTAAFVEFVLAGRYKVYDQYRRVVLRPDREWYTPAAMPITLTRDYDSLLGLTRTLPFRKEIHVYAVPSFNDTLTKDNHMRKEVKVMIRVRNNILLLFSCLDTFSGRMEEEEHRALQNSKHHTGTAWSSQQNIDILSSSLQRYSTSQGRFDAGTADAAV